MFAELRRAVVVLALLTVLTGGLYPLVVTVIARAAFPRQAAGSIIERDGQAVGSDLIGQPFSKPEYFWGRASGTSPVPYNAAASSGTNLGPTNPDLTKAVAERVDALRKADPDLGPVPVDLVTASGSGLDPHISPAAAAVQVRRVARARGLSEDRVRELVARHTEGRQLGILGEPRVNVLRLNLDLDALKGEGRTP
ncbi:MAG: potassium-transporting ATPase subunit KdpC [Gemmataceae bacterium]|nr:potassium-transporting ATPase subunit KdpC [Gemmataceae bacterium]